MFKGLNLLLRSSPICGIHKNHSQSLHRKETVPHQNTGFYDPRKVWQVSRDFDSTPAMQDKSICL